MKKSTLLPVFLAFLMFVCGCKSGSSATGPSQYKVRFDTSKGSFVVEVHRDWAPNGADRFHELVTTGFYDEARFFRVVPGFVVQWGLHRDPKVTERWRTKPIPDDKVTQSNLRGFITFATSGPNSRTTQVFVNLGDNSRLDVMGFAPFGKVVEGLEVVDQINSEYGERPQQYLIQGYGNDYLNDQFPKLDYVKTTKVE